MNITKKIKNKIIKATNQCKTKKEKIQTQTLLTNDKKEEEKDRKQNKTMK